LLPSHHFLIIFSTAHLGIWEILGMSDLHQEPEHVRIGSIVVRCYEFERMWQFRQGALGYVVGHTDEGFVILKPPDGEGPNISLDRAPVKRTGKRSWLHLDLYAEDQQAEVERLVKLGAARYPWRYEPDADYVVLEDPDGNLFCVVQV
jgi:catechol 2,3-dioxygenase-like lactoylglutathione lyase family enzyme